VILNGHEYVARQAQAGVRSPAKDASPRTEPALTATTKPSASACKPSSTTWASPSTRRGIDNSLSIGELQLLRSVRDFARKEWPFGQFG